MAGTVANIDNARPPREKAFLIPGVQQEMDELEEQLAVALDVLEDGTADGELLAWALAVFEVCSPSQVATRAKSWRSWTSPGSTSLSWSAAYSWSRSGTWSVSWSGSRNGSR